MATDHSADTPNVGLSTERPDAACDRNPASVGGSNATTEADRTLATSQGEPSPASHANPETTESPAGKTTESLTGKTAEAPTEPLDDARLGQVTTDTIPTRSRIRPRGDQDQLDTADRTTEVLETESTQTDDAQTHGTKTGDSTTDSAATDTTQAAPKTDVIETDVIETDAKAGETQADSTRAAGSTETRADATDTQPLPLEVGLDAEEDPVTQQRWERFADGSVEQTPPELPRWRRAVGAVRRLVFHEWTVATVASLGLAAVMTWPTLRHPTRTIPQDIYDPLLQAWQVAWGGHALRTDPANLWNANAFYPESDSYAFSDSLLGYAPLGMIGSGPEAAVLRYNILFVLLHALAFLGAYALVRQLGARWPAAAVTGAAFAYAPWRLAQAGHMHVLSTGGIALALAMLARGHGWSLRHGYHPERAKPGWALAGWLVAAWQMTLGFGIGLPFAYVLLLIVVVAGVAWLGFLIARRRRPFPARLFLADLGGGILFSAVSLAMAMPYLRVVAEHPYARRTEEELSWYAPPLHGFLISPAESWLWGDAHEPARASLPFPAEMTLLPGLALIGLAVAGLFLSIWTVRQRLLLALGVAVTVALAMGPNFFGGEYGYLLLYRHLPGWDGIRTPGRLVIWTTLLLGILAAGAVARFAESAQRTAEAARVDERVPTRPVLPIRLAMVIPVLLVLAEGINTTPHPEVPPAPAAMRDAEGPILVLPSGQLEDQAVMLWSTDGFPKLVNGGSGFTPARLDEVRRISQNFPDPASVAYLSDLGVRTVIVLRSKVVGTPWERAADAPVTGLGVTRQEVGDAVVFTLP